MPDYRFLRHCRTADSEAWDILDGPDPVGRVDLHYTSAVVYGLLALERELAEEEVQGLIEMIDTEIIDSVDTPREDFLVSVYVGKSVGIYSDDVFEDDEEFDIEFEDDDDEEEDDEPARNGNGLR